MDGKEIQKSNKQPNFYSKEEQQIVNANQNHDLIQKLAKDRLQKRDKWLILKEEYPALQKINDLSQYVVILTKVVAKKLAIPMSGIDVLGGNPYINKTGLLYKLQKDPRKVVFCKAIPLVLPFDMGMIYSDEKDEDGEKPKIYFSKDGTAMFRGIIRFSDGTEYSDIGTANAAYLNSTWGKMSTMKPYVAELASTRSINRTIRLATGVGLVSIEELNDAMRMGNAELNEETAKKVKPKIRSKADLKLINEIQTLLVKKKYNQARTMTLYKKYKITDLSKADIKILQSIKKDVTADKGLGSDRKDGKPAANKEIKKPVKKTTTEKITEMESLRKRLKMSGDDLDKLCKQMFKGAELNPDKIIAELGKRLEKQKDKRKRGKK